MDNSLQIAAGLHNEAVAKFRSGYIENAIETFNISLNMGLAASGRALFEIYRKQQMPYLAGEVSARAALLEPMNFRFVQDALVFNVRYAFEQRIPYESVSPRVPADWSVIVCSHDNDMYATFQENFESVAGNHRLQFVRISDAAGMNEGYKRGLEMAWFGNIILCHHDIELLVPDFFDRLLGHLDRYDFIGVAGASKMSGPAILFDGHPHLLSRLSQPAKNMKSRILASCSPFAHVRPAAVLDGVFIACKRSALEQLGFDTEITGFHYYDVDLSHRAFKAGYDLAVAPDLALHHQSHGNFNTDWERGLLLFKQKFPELQGEPSPHRHFYTTSIGSENEISVWSWLNTLSGKWDQFRRASAAVQPGLACMKSTDPMFPSV